MGNGAVIPYLDDDELVRHAQQPVPIPYKNATGVLGKTIPFTPATPEAPPMSSIPLDKTIPTMAASTEPRPVLQSPQGKAIPLGRHPGIQGTIDPESGMYNTPPPNQPALAATWAKTENIHNPFLRVLGKIGTGLARGAETVGNIVAPGTMALIPGTSINKGIQAQAQRGIEKTQAQEELEKAETENFKAEAEARKNPPTKIVFDQGVPVAIEAGNQQYAIGDQNMPPQFKAMADAAVAAHKQRVQEVAAAAAGKPDTATEEKQRAEKIRSAQLAGQTVSADDTNWLAAHEAEANMGKDENEATTYRQYLKDKDIADTAENRLAFHQRWQVKPESPNASSNRSDKSYTLQSGRLDKIRQPVDQIIARVGRLNDTLNQQSPQADALVAPELLSIMSGGAGSGLRMNEAEIARIVGGRSVWENLKAAMQHWATNPDDARSITPDQDRQIRALVGEVHKKLVAKQAILDDAEERLISSDDPKIHRQIVAESRKRLDAIDAGEEQGPWSKYKKPETK